MKTIVGPSSNGANSFGGNMVVRAGPSIDAGNDGSSNGGSVTLNGLKLNSFSSGSIPIEPK